jgi:protein-tyrosine phosphatase
MDSSPTIEELACYETFTLPYKERLKEFMGDIYNTVLPANTVIIDEHLIVSGIPITRQNIDGLVMLGVRTFISLMASPLTSLRCCNPNLNDYANPEFVDRDAHMLTGLFHEKECRAIHLPTPDAGTITKAQAKQLLQIMKDAKSRNEAILVHCWRGSHRSWFVARMLKKELDNIDNLEHANARSNIFADSYLSASNLNFPFPPSDSHERSQLLYLAAALLGVYGGGGSLDGRTDKDVSLGLTIASMFKEPFDDFDNFDDTTKKQYW